MGKHRNTRSAGSFITTQLQFYFRKQVDTNGIPRFDKHLEEFFSICDQFELHLVTAKKCIQQASYAQVYMPVPVVPLKNEGQDNSLNYLEFLQLVKTQMTYSKDVHDTLVMAAQNI